MFNLNKFNPFNKKSKEIEVKVEPISYEREYSNEHGFLLNPGDLGDFMKFQVRGNPEGYIHALNSYGYLDTSVGEYLNELISDSNYEIYTKSIYSDDMESVFNEGIRCLGNSTSGFGNVPKSIESINLDNTISPQYDLTTIVDDVKKNYGISQGSNPINGTVIIKIPKDISKEDKFYYNDSSNTFNIRPDFIDCFIQTNENHVAKNITFNNINDKTL